MRYALNCTLEFFENGEGCMRFSWALELFSDLHILMRHSWFVL